MAYFLASSPKVLGTEYQCSGVFLRDLPIPWLSSIPGRVASGFGFLALLEIPEIRTAVSSISFFFPFKLPRVDSAVRNSKLSLITLFNCSS